jgi:glycosyltransferase involved in cell wall biosynthesis
VELADPWQSANAASSVPAVTVVVPTRGEAANVTELVRRLECVLRTGLEVVFVDDSSDETPAVIRETSRTAAIPIRLIHRPPGRRGDGLSGAVVEGLRAARARVVCVMDGDLQHPPELLPQLLRRGIEDDLDIVVASRRHRGGSTANFGVVRALLSEVSTFAARALFPLRLRPVSDPMSGFFLVRRDAVELERLHPRGFKILLELLLRNRGLRVGEVPFHFGRRNAGDSKASLGQGLLYLRQLAALRFAGATASWVTRPCIAGARAVARLLNLATQMRVARASCSAAAVTTTGASKNWSVVGSRGSSTTTDATRLELSVPEVQDFPTLLPSERINERQTAE